jgi:RNA methyltransferase, TrmH family
LVKIRDFSFKGGVSNPELMEKLATTVHPDGVVATACRRENIPITSDNFDCGLVLEKIQDPGNLGTIIRTTVATDVDFLWLSEDCVDLDNPKVLRSSVGEWFKVKAQKHGNLVDLVQEYRNKNVQVVATSLEATKSHWDIDWTQPTIILLGNESQGLSTELESLATQKVKIPLANDVESLNVAIATAFILAEYQRQRKYQ